MTSLTLVRRIRAAPELVFDAFTKPAHILRWWGPDPGPVLIAETDVRVGGGFRVRFRMLDGGEHESSGTYREVLPNERLVFTWRWVSTPERESEVTVALRPIPGGTELTLTHARLADEATRDSHREGWSGALDKLVALLGGLPEPTGGA